MKLEYVELSSFKSFAGKQRFGPITSGLTCILGSNGNGKSNLLDAILFGLDLSEHHMRVENMDELKSTMASEKGKDTYVELMLSDEDGLTVSFRKALHDSTARYYIDNEDVSVSEYQLRLSDLGLPPHLPDVFLVGQGQICSYTSRSHANLSAILNYLSGAHEYEAAEQALETDFEAICTEVSSLKEAKRFVDSELTAAEHAAEELQQVRMQHEELSQLTVLRHRCTLKMYENQKTKTANDIIQIETRLKEASINGEMSLSDVVLAKLAEYNTAKSNLTMIENEITRQEHDEQQAQVEINLLTSRAHQLAETTKFQNSADATGSIPRAAAEKLKTLISNYEEQVRETESYYQQKLSKESTIPVSDDTVAHYENYIAAMSYSDKAIKEAEVSMNAAYEELLSSKDRVAQLKSASKVAETQLALEYKAFNDANILGLQEAVMGLSSLHEDCPLLQPIIGNLSLLLSDLSARIPLGMDPCLALSVLETGLAMFNDIENVISEFRRENFIQRMLSMSNKIQAMEEATNSAVNKEMEDMTKMKNELIVRHGSDIIGFLKDVICVDNPMYLPSLAQALGSLYNGLVVKNFDVAAQCIEFLKRSDLPRGPIIPLSAADKILPYKLGAGIPSGLASARYALDVVVIDNTELHHAVSHLLGNTILAPKRNISECLTFKESHQVTSKIVCDDNGIITKAGIIRLAKPTRLLLSNGSIAWKKFTQELKAQKLKLETTKRAMHEFNTSMIPFQRAEKQIADSIRSTITSIETLCATEHSVHVLKAAFQEGTALVETNAKKYTLTLKTLQDALDNRARKADEYVLSSYTDPTPLKQYIARREAQDMLENLTKKSLAAFAANSQEPARELALCLRGLKQRRNAVSHIYIPASTTVIASRDVSAFAYILKEFYREVDLISVMKYECEKQLSEIAKLLKTLREGLPEILTGKELLEKKRDQQIAICDRSKLQFEVAQATYSAWLKEHHSLNLSLYEHKMREATLDMKIAELTEASSALLPVAFGTSLSHDDISLLDCTEQRIKELDTKIADCQRFLASAIINEHAGEDLEALTVSAERLKDSLRTATSTKTNLARQLSSISEIRATVFMRCFNAVNEYLASCYRSFTIQQVPLHDPESSRYRAKAGIASLELDDDSSRQPYNCGIEFHAVPPDKRFTALEMLSGGEKSIAAAALVFSFIQWKSPPMVLFDEIDAALDSRSTRLLADRLSNANGQFLTVTFKDE